MNPTVAVVKRLMDIVLSTLGLFTGLPFFALAAMAIKLDTPGDIFFRQERVGLDGREIRMVKFRTMRQDAEKDSGPVWAKEEDDRITRVGRLLRKTRMDEIPQLFNVFRGEMSLVGPRPERPFFVSQLDGAIPYYDERIISVKPGITGLAQINEGYDTSIDSVKMKLLYDHAYGASLTRFRSFLAMDLYIIGRTVMIVLTGKGAH